MTILQAAYAACKAVIASAGREPLRAIIYELNHSLSSPPPGYVDRSMLGYLARQQRSQFLGYLLVDQERARLASAPMPALIPPLSDEQRNLLLAAHSQMVALNHRALEPLLNKFPHAAEATDPYGAKLPLTAALDHRSPPFAVEAFESVAVAFQSHPGLRLAITSPPELVNTITAENLLEGVENLEREVRSDGPGKTPRELGDFLHSEPTTSGRRFLVRFLASLMSLRASLRVLDQMLYQAVQTDKPPVLDQNNIADLHHLGSSVTGEGVRLLFQPDLTTFALEPGDIVLLKAIPNMFKLEGLVLSASVSSRFGGDGDATTTLTGRIVSDILDPYARFAERL